ncbi:2-nitropropane dioxygenase NPD [Planococcus antarcticus DSM 14505]|uniref:Probable nitronate monooxygenase n=1 Tax=Planococcus antarcticus DSM 14505 TaxID=1185653 RepID=A0A1C7DC71_9BACL|nr:nitronate monooxygenase family protein [Planococcus antarcticus]ANU08982.1 nitronate monooxygenase [Planococcus antarcticus DSM 14505]EIM07231.1 2-nitropropane dioxygenase NPD [Planococcus antarcticus DSM 14505]
MISLETGICRLFKIDYPIVQAGMAGGPTTVELVAEVSNAGGLGTLGAAYMAPDALRQAIKEIRCATQKPFGVNIFAAPAQDDFRRLAEVQKTLSPFRSQLGIREIQASYQSPDWSAEQFNICIEEGVSIVSTAFGCLSAPQMKAAKERQVKIVAMVTTVAEAKQAEASGVDALVAQGSEAGGHRSTFSLDQHPAGAQIGTLSLVPQVVDAVGIPVIAAGGIVDGRGLVASLALGAQGVQIGTRFVSSTESGVHSAYKQAVFKSDEESTVVTKSFSGRPARGIKNRFIQEFEQTGINPLPFPSQNTITKDIRAAAAKANNPEFMSLWAGQSTRSLKEEVAAAEIVRTIIEEAKGILS